ncbi:MAG TPA: YtxH domain-containing protein [Pyrinomonadaceae bacterium]|nr:YtxH domain-containing protein [Pyrinomonadaceae bacterium]
MENDDRRGGSDVSTRLTYLLIGGGIGAIIALLFAPKSGTELRGDIADVTRKGIDKSREGARYIGDKAGDYYGAVREKAGDWYGSAREGVARKGGQFSAAVEAGKQAYNEEKRKTELSGASEAQPTYPPQGDLS